MVKPVTAMAVRKMLGALPNAIAQTCTKGWGASNEERVSKSGVQSKRRIVTKNPIVPESKKEVRIPRIKAALEFDVSEVRYIRAGTGLDLLGVTRSIRAHHWPSGG